MSSFLRKIFGAKRPGDSREDESFYFLPQVRGVLHIGANYGQERDLYAKNGLRALWVEAIPDVYQKLVENLRPYPNQKALNYLLTDQENKEYAFHLSDNEAASSSIFEFAEHKQLWPEVKMVRQINLRSATLPQMFKREQIRAEDYDALVMDTQGSELLILKGARVLLPNFRFIKTEVADFESYKGGCVLTEMDAFMKENGFAKAMSKVFAKGKGVGAYHEIVYARS
jgi:FkbM family methyltransferase